MFQVSDEMPLKEKKNEKCLFPREQVFERLDQNKLLKIDFRFSLSVLENLTFEIQL
jgi:hypothetical protein